MKRHPGLNKSKAKATRITLSPEQQALENRLLEVQENPTTSGHTRSPSPALSIIADINIPAASKATVKDKIKALPRIPKVHRPVISPVIFEGDKDGPKKKKPKPKPLARRWEKQKERRTTGQTDNQRTSTSFTPSIFERLGTRALSTTQKATPPRSTSSTQGGHAATQTEVAPSDLQPISQTQSAHRRRRRARHNHHEIKATLSQARRTDLIAPAIRLANGRVCTRDLRLNFHRYQSEIAEAALRPLRNAAGHLLPVDIVYNKPPPPQCPSNVVARTYRDYRLLREAQARNETRRSKAAKKDSGDGTNTVRKATRPTKLSSVIRQAKNRSPTKKN